MEKPYRKVARIKGVAMLLAGVPFYLLLLTGLADPPDRGRPDTLLLVALALVYVVQALTSSILASRSSEVPKGFMYCAILAALVSVVMVVAQFLPIGWFFAPYVWIPIVGILTAVGGLIADEWWLVMGGGLAAIVTPVSAFLTNGHYWVPVVSTLFGMSWLLTGRAVPVSDRIPRI